MPAKRSTSVPRNIHIPNRWAWFCTASDGKRWASVGCAWLSGCDIRKLPVLVWPFGDDGRVGEVFGDGGRGCAQPLEPLRAPRIRSGHLPVPQRQHQVDEDEHEAEEQERRACRRSHVEGLEVLG